MEVDELRVGDRFRRPNRAEAIRRGQEGFEFFGYAIQALVARDTVPGRTTLWADFIAKRGETAQQFPVAVAGQRRFQHARQQRELLGAEVTEDLERQARAVYDRGRDVARERGIIIADTKFEFGRDSGGQILLIDEVLTPDSSRFWPASEYQTGRPQPSYDKQPLRDFLEEQRRLGRWNGEAPAPTLPPELVEATSRRYRDAFRRLIGSDLPVTDLS